MVGLKIKRARRWALVSIALLCSAGLANAQSASQSSQFLDTAGVGEDLTSVRAGGNKHADVDWKFSKKVTNLELKTYSSSIKTLGTSVPYTCFVLTGKQEDTEGPLVWNGKSGDKYIVKAYSEFQKQGPGAWLCNESGVMRFRAVIDVSPELRTKLGYSLQDKMPFWFSVTDSQKNEVLRKRLSLVLYSESKATTLQYLGSD